MMASQAGSDRNSFADKRIRNLESLNIRYISILETLAASGEFHAGIHREKETLTIFSAAREHINHIIEFSCSAFLSPDENDSSFVLTDYEPATCRNLIEAEIDRSVKNGVFAYALASSRPILLTGDNGTTTVLHAIATQRRVRGMFVGIIPGAGPRESDPALKAITIIMTNIAYALESSALYMMLKGYAQDLEKRVRDKTKDLSEARKKAEEASRVKSEFLAMMSHEIRTPLVGVIGIAELLLDGDLSVEQRQHAELILRSAEALLKILNQVLDFSKGEAGKIELEKVDLNLKILLDDLTEMFSVQALNKGIRFSCSAKAETFPRLLGDSARLRQVLVNLIGNALKFTSEGAVDLNVSLIKQDETTAELLFIISDTGIGIPPEAMGRLFKSFSQVDASTTRQYGGTGLGLVISKNLVELMGGAIDVQSQVGKGTEFRFSMPFEKTTVTSASLAPEWLEMIKGKRILIADGNEEHRSEFVSKIQHLGCAPEVAVTGQDALGSMMRAYQDGRPFSAVFLDMLLPDMDGSTLGFKVKGSDVLTEIPLFMLYPREMEKSLCVLKGPWFADCLPRDATEADLLDCIYYNCGAEGRSAEGRIMGNTECSDLSSAGKGMKILVADDNEINQKVAVGLLRKYGIHVDTVKSGAEAIATTANARYDLILMDIEMSGMDGCKATEIIRARESQAGTHVPIIGVSAHATDAARLRCLSAGMDNYLYKPLRERELMEMIGRYDLPLQKVDAFNDPTRGESAEETFNLADLKERLGDDDEFIREIVGIFLNDAPGRIQAMRTLLQAGDMDGVKMNAHSLKGSASNVSAMAISKSASAIENAVARADVEKLDALIGDVDCNLTHFRIVLSERGIP